MKTIIKNNVVKTVSDKAAKIAIQTMGWSEVFEAKKPGEVGTKTKPPIISPNQPIKLREAKVEYPGDEVKTDLSAGGILGLTGDSVEHDPEFEKQRHKDIIDRVNKILTKPVSEKKTRKPAVKSKSTK